MTDPLLDREILERAFRRLAEKLVRRQIVGEVHVFGGAAMVLAFDARVATRDVDALFEPDRPVLAAASEVARELDLPRSWLHTHTGGYVSGRAGRGAPVFDHPHLRVMVTPVEHLLAMKVRAARPARDVADLELLLAHLEISDVDAVTEIVARYFPDEPLDARARMIVEDVLARRGDDAA